MIAFTTESVRIAETPGCYCPVCGDRFDCSDCRDEGDTQVHLAAHCCLWHEFDHATRVRIANRVESGATWLDAITEQRK